MDKITEVIKQLEEIQNCILTKNWGPGRIANKLEEVKDRLKEVRND